MASVEESVAESWAAVTTAGESPSPRYGLGAAVVDGVIYTFGGCSNVDDRDAVYHNDFYKLTVTSAADSCALDWEKLTPTGEIPSSREGQGLIAIGQQLYILGGSTHTDDDVCSTDIYCYSIETNRCEKVEYEGEAPSYLNSTFCAMSPSIYAFGGIKEGEASNDLHLFDTASKTWTKLTPSNTPPSPRCDHAAARIGKHIYVFGGCAGEDLTFGDTWRLDTSDLSWTEISTAGTSPGSRDFSSMVAHGKQGLVVFGGTHDDTPLSSTFYLNLEDGQWAEVGAEGQNKPSGRFSHAAVMLNSQMVISCGMTDDEEFSSTHVLVLPQLEEELADASFEATPLPPTRYETSVPVPARRRQAPQPPKQLISPRDFEERKQMIIKHITDSFDELTERFFKLDQDREALRVERAAFEEERRNYLELFEKQQKELKEMFEHHRTQNDEWLQARREENDKERQFIANEKVRWEKAHAKLEEERTVFDQKNKKMEAIMKQFQGLG